MQVGYESTFVHLLLAWASILELPLWLRLTISQDCTILAWYRLRDSNPRPSPCKGDTLYH